MGEGYTDKARAYASKAYNIEPERVNLDVEDGSYIYYDFPKFYIVNPARTTRKRTTGLTVACRYVQEELNKNARNSEFAVAIFK